MTRTQETLLAEFQWQATLLENLDVGVVVLDRNYNIKLWNAFMANHSGKSSDMVRDRSLFELFSEFPHAWFKRKLDTVFMLHTRSFITWQERSWLFKFKPSRPITGRASQMYQNVTLIPLSLVSGQTPYVGILIYDMTDTALSNLDLEVANDELGRLSRTDRLTGLLNRGYWEECLENEFRRFCRTRQSSTLIMLDIDNFKSINDNFGHQAGDQVIRTLANLIKHHIRTTDVAGRYGGEEFGILLVDTDAPRAQILAERLRRAVENCIVHHHNIQINFTISLGIAECSETFMEHGQWIEYADQALYQSKKAGRNQLTTTQP